MGGKDSVDYIVALTDIGLNEGYGVVSSDLYALALNEISFEQNLTYSEANQTTWHLLLTDLGLLDQANTSTEELGGVGSAEYNRTLIILATTKSGEIVYDPITQTEEYDTVMANLALNSTLNMTVEQIESWNETVYNATLIDLFLTREAGTTRSVMGETAYQNTMIDLVLSTGTYVPNATSLVDLGGRGSYAYVTLIFVCVCVWGISCTSRECKQEYISVQE